MTAPRLLLSELRYLSGAMTFVGKSPGGGACVQRAAALTLDLREALLTFGTFVHPITSPEDAAQPGRHDSPFIHAWVEWQGAVYAPTLMERHGTVLRPIEPADYYRVNNATNIRRTPREAFDKVARRYRLAAAFKHGSARAGSGEITEALLAAAGVRWTLTPDRALIPKE